MNYVHKKLDAIITHKKTVLCLSADVTKADELLSLAEQCGDSLCALKTHMDIISDFTPLLTKKLREIADAKGFLIFEDRKFADIGNTVQLQYTEGVYKISSWADIVNAHVISGPGIVEALKAASNLKHQGLLLIAQMSSKENLFTEHYQEAALRIAEQNSDYVMGFICQNKIASQKHFWHFTPGVQAAVQKDGLDQRYRSVEQAILQDQCDIVIVGRGIYQATDPALVARHYAAAAWEAFTQRA